MVTNPPSVGARMGTPAGRWVLLATIAGSSMALLDATVVNVALPSLGLDFGAGFPTLQWIVNAYTIPLVALILLAGALGDRFGRRRVFVVGVVWFGVASVLCGLAANAELLVAARALQGVGAALLTPGSLAIISATFAATDRARAVGTWSGLSGVAAAIGPLAGGALVAWDWRAVFLVNVPIVVVIVTVSLRHVPESLDTGQGRSPRPLVPWDLFADRRFTVANVVTLLVYAGLGVLFFLLALQLQIVAGFSPLATGTALLPVTVLMLLLSSRAGALAGRIGPRLPLTGGPLLAAAGFLLTLRIGHGASYLVDVLPAVLVLGLGLSLTVAPLTSTVLESVDPRHAGTACGVNNAIARAAGPLAVAVIPVAAGLGGADYTDPLSFDPGFRMAMMIGAELLALAALLALVLLREPRAAPAPAPAPAPAGKLAERMPVERYWHCGVTGPQLHPVKASAVARTAGSLPRSR